jgi:uncharacterized membrane protein YgcG
MRSQIGIRTLAGIALLGLLGSAGRAHALTAEVRDEAGFFTSETVAQANQIIKELKQRYRKDVLVETVHVPEGQRQEASSPDAHVKGRFFADWAARRAREEGVNGIYVLITREPGHVEVAVGNHTRAVFSDEQRHRLAQILLNRFKQKEYDAGLLEAVRYVRSALAAAPKAVGAAVLAGAEHPRLPYAPRGTGGGLGVWHWLGLSLAVLVGVWIVSAVFRAVAGAGAQPAYGGPGGPSGYGPAAYAPAGGGGGFFSSLLGGMFGAAAGSWLYDRFSGGQSPPVAAAAVPASAPEPEDTDYAAEGGDFDSQGASGSDAGAGDFDGLESPVGDMDTGGDFGGGDFGDDAGSGGDF